MAARPSAPPSPQARRQAQRLALQAALVARDRRRMEQLLGQWVHRHGVSSLAALDAELAEVDPQGWAWWQRRDAEATRPAPAPSHPALVRLRSWLPDREDRRAA